MVSKRHQNFIGIALFIIGCANLAFFIDYAQVNSPEYLGIAVGQTMALGFVALALTIPVRLNISIGFLFAVVWAGSASTISYDIYQNTESEKEMANSFVDILSDLENDKTIVAPDGEPEGLSLTELITIYFSNIQEMRREYFSAIEQADLSSMLSAEYLTLNSKAEASTRILRELQAAIPIYEKRTIEVMLNFETSLESRNDSESVSALVGFRKTRDAGVADIKKFYKNQSDLIKTMQSIIDLSKGLGDQLQTQGKQLLFPNQKSLKQYNSYLETLSTQAREETEILQDSQNKTRRAIDRLSNMNYPLYNFLSR